MSDTNQPIRVVLGPLARALVQGSGSNRGQALDDAIKDLTERAQSPGEGSDVLADLEGRIDALTAVTERQANTIDELRKLVVLELQMTRVMVGSLMATTNQEQQHLRIIADTAVAKFHDTSQLLDASERERLQSKEEQFLTMTRQELERGAVVQEQDKEKEFER